MYKEFFNTLFMAENLSGHVLEGGSGKEAKYSSLCH